MTMPSLLIQFDFETWKPTEVFLHGNNDEETAKLQKIADQIIAIVEEND